MTCLKWMERTAELGRRYNGEVRSVGENREGKTNRIGEGNKSSMNARGEREGARDKSGAKLNRSLASIPWIGRYVCLHSAARQIGQHKTNEMGKYARAHPITIVDIQMITAGMLSSVSACVFFFICVHLPVHKV